MAEAPTPGGADTLRARLEFEHADVDPADVATIVGNILAGAVDGAHDQVLNAIALRLHAVNGGLRWKIDLPDVQVTQDELTLGEARLVQSLAKKSWLTIDPINDVAMTIAVITALLHTRAGLPLDKAVARVDKMPAVDVAQAIKQYTVSLPFDGASSPSSTSASGASAGRPRSRKSRGSATSAAS